MAKKSPIPAKPMPAAPQVKVAPTVKAEAPRAPLSSVPSDNGKAVSPDTVRARAYEKWEQAGRPEGDGIGFWLEAERELLQGP